MIGYIYTAALLSACEMFRRNPDLSAFTPQTGDREPNHSFHFGCELKEFFPWLSCDFDIRKSDHENKRPDLILHKRGGNRFNLLAVEVKRKGNANVDGWICEADERKIRHEWFGGHLQYPYGLSIVIDERTTDFAFNLLINGLDRPIRRDAVTCANGFYPADEVQLIMNQIKSEKTSNIEADTSAAERKLDGIVFDALGLTIGERDAVYEAVIDLVSKRLQRAQTITI